MAPKCCVSTLLNHHSKSEREKEGKLESRAAVISGAVCFSGCGTHAPEKVDCMEGSIPPRHKPRRGAVGKLNKREQNKNQMTSYNLISHIYPFLFLIYMN